jgi:Nitronate monooxygenase
VDTRTAIVTGTSNGIGLALAQAYQSRHRRGRAHPALRLGGQFEYSSAPGARRRLAGGIADGRGLAAAFALGAEGVQIGSAFLPCAGSGASEAYRTAISLFAANGTDLTDAFTGRLARGIRNRLMNEFRHVSSPPLPFPMQHALTQTVATPASAQGTLELMTIWAGQNARLCHSTDATEFITQLIAEAETVISKYWEAVSAVRETRDEEEA